MPSLARVQGATSAATLGDTVDDGVKLALADCDGDTLGLSETELVAVTVGDCDEVAEADEVDVDVPVVVSVDDGVEEQLWLDDTEAVPDDETVDECELEGELDDVDDWEPEVVDVDEAETLLDRDDEPLDVAETVSD